MIASSWRSPKCKNMRKNKDLESDRTARLTQPHPIAPEHFQPDRNRPSEAGGPRLIKMLYKQQAGAAGRMSTIFQTG
jgi:hypothetical protein